MVQRLQGKGDEVVSTRARRWRDMGGRTCERRGVREIGESGDDAATTTWTTRAAGVLPMAWAMLVGPFRRVGREPSGERLRMHLADA